MTYYKGDKADDRESSGRMDLEECTFAYWVIARTWHGVPTHEVTTSGALSVIRNAKACLNERRPIYKCLHNLQQGIIYNSAPPKNQSASG